MTSGTKNPEIEKKINELYSLILKKQESINQIQAADPSKKGLIESKLKTFEDNRGKGFFYPYLTEGEGHGPFSKLIDGSIKYDLIEGIGFNLFGHSPSFFIKSCLEAATVDSVMCGNLQPYTQAMDLTVEMMKSVEGTKLKHFWFAGSGSFANDMALKLLWQKQAPKYTLIAFTKAFAGRSIATQDITYNESYRELMPKSINVKHAPHFDQKNPADSLKNTLTALKKIKAEDKDGICALSIELIQGEAGFVYGTKEYYEGIFEWAKENGIYVWVDEVQTFGRTHELFAFQMFGLEKYVDIVTVAKALQIGGVLYSEALNPKPGLIAGTFNGSLASIIAGKNALRFLREGNFYGSNGRIAQIEAAFKQRFQQLSTGSCKGKIGYFGGIGTMISFEVGDSSNEVTDKYIRKLFDNGLICFKAGKDPVRVRFLLPVSLTEDHINEIFQIIEKTAHEVL